MFAIGRFLLLLVAALIMMPTSIIAWSVSPRTLLRSLSRSRQSTSWTAYSQYTTRPAGSFFRLSSSSSENDSEKKRVVFLGTPDVAATTLQAIYEDSIREDSLYELVGVVTQPPKRRGRKKDKLEPSPVAVVAEELGIPAMWPEKVSPIYCIAFCGGVGCELCC